MASTPSAGEEKARKVKNLLASYYEVTDQELDDATVSNSVRFVVPPAYLRV
jgi:hypothetical protein